MGSVTESYLTCPLYVSLTLSAEWSGAGEYNLSTFSFQVLEMIAPPYSPEFIQLFLPIVRNEEITGRLRSADRTDDVSLFLGEFEGHRHFRLAPRLGLQPC